MEEFKKLQIQLLRGTEVQIHDHVRQLIISGQLKEGAKLPPTETLAGLWGVGTITVQHALTPLAKEGLLIRRRSVGTFVRQREERLTCVGVYDLAGTLRESLFEQALQAALKEELTAAGIEMDVWLDPRAVAGEPWLPLVKAAEHREFQALIATTADLPRLSWQRRLPVPTAFWTSANIPTAVGLQYERFAELSVRALAQQGCRSLGLICAMPTNLYPGFYERLMNQIGDLGLTVKNEWMRVPTGRESFGGLAQEQFGYREFLRLWSQPEKPAGLIVYPDTAARGVILGLQAQQVRVPEVLKLVLHKNESVGLLCPVPATFLVLSERAIAQALIAQVQKQLRGASCEPISISFDTKSNEAGNQQPT